MPATATAPARILALEDDGALLELVGCVLEADGHRVRGCGTVAEALGAARREPPDLVVLDLVLGGPDDGWAFLERLRADPRTRAAPVVVCTADAAGLRERADVVARQAAGVVAKPFELDALAGAVRRALRRG